MKKIAIFICFFLGIFLINQAKAINFTDIENATYKEAIEYLANNGIVNGYSDNSFKPNKKLNRAEFLKILLEAQGKITQADKEKYNINCFSDVAKDQWYTPYVCYAKDKNIISGYADYTFRPANNVNLAEAMKIVVNTMGLAKGTEGENWYDTYLNTLSEKAYIPADFFTLTQEVKRGQIAEMIWRVMEKISTKESATAENLKNPTCQIFEEEIPDNIDMERVRATWLSWINTERAKYGLDPYVYNNQLNRTAYLWSEYAKERGYIDHKRPGQSAYYDYNIITKWFADKGLTFKNVNRVTYSENIGWGVISCNKSDCTDEMIDSVRLTFDFYMAEKGKAYQPHYSSMVNKYFTEIGMGLAINENTGKYYITTHYATAITSNPMAICK